MVDVSEARWYVIHTFSGYEALVRDSIFKLVENNALEECIFDALIPVEDDIVEKADGKKKVVERKKFPGYLFIKMIYSNRIWFLITNIRGVTGFVGPAARPQPLTDDETRRMGLEKIEVSELELDVGDNIRILNGPFAEFIGAIEEISFDKQKLRVNVSMFGRETPIDLDFAQVEKLQ